MLTFIALPGFTRFAADYFDDSDLTDLPRFIGQNPKVGDVVPGTGGVRTLRWSRTGMGQRGGLRIIITLRCAWPYLVTDGICQECARDYRRIHPEPVAGDG